MNQAVVEQKVQCPVDCGRRCRAAVLRAELRQNVIGSQWLVALPDQFQYPFADGGQPQAATVTQLDGSGQCLLDAGLVPMMRARSGWRRNIF